MEEKHLNTTPEEGEKPTEAVEAEPAAEVDDTAGEGEICDTPPTICGDGETNDELEELSLLDGDLRELRDEFPELSSVASIADLSSATRYGALRDLGLTPREAFLATRPRQPRYPDPRSHLVPVTHSTAKPPTGAMSRRELKLAREIFPNLCDQELQALYKKVTKT